ncbi:hypothetical protein [Streptomyces sp. NBC_00038]|uniref:hypothetical protein n=1 Tax=Streptomyces sp. NBC_00038 TaxID=2903615 RepID=UPI00224DCF11|nr:hypothetical protein [Streptomyces sp. NBC_00038]MCX5562750.1 hypothetical protein [Streptomyces sp. NBC_00038]MCX5563600.1 hypothetical protein [Streptomyces sp. NBC_00038]
MKVYTDPLLAETVPDGTFGGARPRRGRVREQQRTNPAEGRRRLAELTSEIAAASASRRARLASTPTARRAA